MAEYTYADVIINPEDPRVEIGKEYYAATSISSALRAANVGNESLLVKLDSVNREPMRTLITSKPFIVSYKHGNGGDTDFIIRKKEPEKKYLPFDLSKEEDKAKLRGAWVRYKETPNIEKQINGLNAACVFLYGMENQGLKPKELFELWEFIDGTPCGKRRAE